jgi:hypothetical protein
LKHGGSIVKEGIVKKSFLPIVVFIFLLLFSLGCAAAPAPVPTAVSTIKPPTNAPSPEMATPSVEPTATATPEPLSWEEYANEMWGFSLEHPSAWVVMSNGEKSGFLGWQVYWGVDNFDPMQMPGDRPAVDQTTDVIIAGQPAKRLTGHYLGAMGDMGFQQYVRYTIQKGDLVYSFTLLAVDVRGVSQNMMTEPLPISETDLRLFEQMMANLKFNE